ncbi:MAG: hypothetical protein Q7T11_08475 [Deltaproteobacteria bacterium]|nr:hypothetical protein [Deltaproteobacteria bacterium]
MIQQEILKLLQKISAQLDDISTAQGEIKDEIFLLHREFLRFQEHTLKNLESSLAKSPEFLN